MYDKLSSNEIVDEAPTFGNNNEADTHGGEISANWNITESIRLAAWYAYMDGEINNKVSGEKTEIDSLPKNQAYIRSYVNLPYDLALDTAVYFVDETQSISRKIPEYYRLDARLGWFPMKNLELSLAGQNLLLVQDGDFVDEHQEFGHVRPDSGFIERAMYGKVAYRW